MTTATATTTTTTAAAAAAAATATATMLYIIRVGPISSNIWRLYICSETYLLSAWASMSQ
ncbi:hypothetical protein N7457_002523 [Penicillium paradoxum]|uniref:uncharacterized protein n=1 Tax=Penicillium paradoxum TaxID=176176 RepID=UPI002549712B|nr:uncharacterized protein N7457_002523 [Penicillium paradoxum]KAJ5787533.1 hypothetical protein N7457_002523 [Penicillium paradoxum]